ncbi:MAG TPA: type II secretion system F family protein, partial [Pirellulales bacterium]
MPDFAYTARNRSGAKVTGMVAAANRREALTELGRQALFPLVVEAAPESKPMFAGRRVGAQLIATFYGQLADLLHSGVPLLRSLQVLERQTKHYALKEVLTDVRQRVEEGETLAVAMARHPRAFNELAISVVRAGGEGGFLEEALEQVSDFVEKQEDLKGRTIGAIAYPAFLAVVGSVVVMGLMIFLVPKFAGIFDRLRQRGELPALTEWLLGVSQVLQSYGLAVGAVFVAGIFGLRYYAETDSGRTMMDRVKLMTPVAGPIYVNLAVSRFCRVLGTLLRNGVPILKSLEISSDSTGNRVLAQAIRRAAENISSGQSLAKPLAASGRFPANVVEMIAVAEEANSLEKVLVDTADGLDRRTWRQLDLAVKLLEPLMLLMLAGVVLLIVMGLLLPIVKMSMAM